MTKNRKEPSFIRPFYQTKKDIAQALSPPILMPDSLPLPFRRFCCLVVVESKNDLWYGSGTLTNMGILTAYHLFDNNTKITDKWVSFLLENDDWITIDLGDVIFEDRTNDIIIISRPILSSYFKPIKIGYPHEKFLFSANDLFAFGCPLGLLGKIWKPRFVGISENKIYTKNFACLGISGGGIFVRKENEWYVCAIHSVFCSQSMTLLSSIVNLKV
jgi:hypothetical protein